MSIHGGNYLLRKLIVCISLCSLLGNVLLANPCFAQGESSQPTSYENDPVQKQYLQLTKDVLLTEIEMERFSLNYRLEGGKDSRFKWLTFAGTAEANAACNLAFEITSINQFGIGRKNPLRMDTAVLKRGFKSALVGSVIGGSGSAFALGMNTIHAIQSYRHGFDARTANKFIVEHAKRLDDLLAQRDAFVRAHPDHPGYKAAMAEGAVLVSMRDAILNEYVYFHKDIRQFRVFENLFFFLNIGTSVVAATGARQAILGLKHPVCNGPANILFITTGGLLTASPLLATAAGRIAGKMAEHSLYRKLGGKPKFDPHSLAGQCDQLEIVLKDLERVYTPAPSATLRASSYAEAIDNFQKQLRAENRVMRFLETTAVESVIAGPAIGGLTLTQGILGTRGYYHYATRPRQQIDHYYKGAVVGVNAAAIAVGGTALGIIGDWVYVHRLRKNKKLPAQIIQDRLKNLAEVEQTVKAL